MKIKVEVTQAHIDKGVHRDDMENPVTLALQDAGFLLPALAANRIQWLDDRGKDDSRAMPRSVRNFMRVYDHPKDFRPETYRRRCKPFCFEVEVFPARN